MSWYLNRKKNVIMLAKCAAEMVAGDRYNIRIQWKNGFHTLFSESVFSINLFSKSVNLFYKTVFVETIFSETVFADHYLSFVS